MRKFQRLKEDEARRKSLDWQLSRSLSKLNYRIHTDAIKDCLIPKTITKKQSSITYANEADVLNIALFGMTAREWKVKKKKEDGNIRDYAEIEQLIVLSNLESLNAELILEEIEQKDNHRWNVV